MVKDIAQQQFAQNFYFDWYGLYPLTGVAYFSADDGIHGRELWRTDGTAGGTFMVKDICPGACNSFPLYYVVATDRIYFAADDGEHGRELWRSDGTEAGTTLVADVEPGFRGAGYDGFLALGTSIVFAARTQTGGCDLWRSDGTALGTMSIADLCPSLLRALGTNGFFSADTPGTGRELWSTDGTPGGTQLVLDINPGNGGSIDEDQFRPSGALYAAVGLSRLFFVANDGTSGRELWSSDGTPSGTQPVKDIATGAPDSTPTFLTMSGGSLFFRADDGVHGNELWKSDGSEIGTTLVKDIDSDSFGSAPRLLRDVDGVLFFAASDTDHGGELWRSDGTETGTTLVQDINPGTASSMITSPFFGAAAGGSNLYFFADDGTHGLEPWVSDGATATLLLDIFPGSNGSNLNFNFPSEPLVLGATALLLGYNSDVGIELYTSDGTPAGTGLLADIDVEPSALPPIIDFYFNVGRGVGTAANGGVLFGARDDTHGLEPWASDATDAGTVLLGDLATGSTAFGPIWSVPRDFSALADRTMFIAQQSSEPSALWTSDGTAAGTSPVSLSGSSGEALELVSNHGIPIIGIGDELWTTDGTPAGATQLFASQGSLLTPSGDSTYFTADDGNIGNEIWRTDGTIAGTEVAADVTTGPASSNFTQLLDASGTLFFATDDGTSGTEPWVLGPAGAQLLGDVRTGPAGSIEPFLEQLFRVVPALASSGTRMFFRADDGSHGRELWLSEGNAMDATLVLDIRPGAESSDPIFIASDDLVIYFSADDGTHGRELWISDGTELGTHLVKDIVPGVEGSRPRDGVVAGGTLYFSALDPAFGVELWKSDGTEGGTTLFQDIFTGPAPSTPFRLTLSAPYLYFFANDGSHGFEPWALAVPALSLKPSFVDVDDSAGNGNGLWELGESVALQPVWENLSIADITAVTATAAGANGAQCNDEVAAYGTFTSKEQRSCLATGDCYDAELIGPRPSPHWDVALQETLSTGKVFDWSDSHRRQLRGRQGSRSLYPYAEALLHAGLTVGARRPASARGSRDAGAGLRCFFRSVWPGATRCAAGCGRRAGQGRLRLLAGRRSVFVDIDPEDPFCRASFTTSRRARSRRLHSDELLPRQCDLARQFALLLGKTLTKRPIPASFSGSGGSYDCSVGTPDIHFLDVDENDPFCAAAHYLWATEISQGCDDSNFCPDYRSPGPGGAVLVRGRSHCGCREA